MEDVGGKMKYKIFVAMLLCTVVLFPVVSAVGEDGLQERLGDDADGIAVEKGALEELDDSDNLQERLREKQSDGLREHLRERATETDLVGAAIATDDVAREEISPKEERDMSCVDLGERVEELELYVRELEHALETLGVDQEGYTGLELTTPDLEEPPTVIERMSRFFGVDGSADSFGGEEVVWATGKGDAEERTARTARSGSKGFFSKLFEGIFKDDNDEDTGTGGLIESGPELEQAYPDFEVSDVQVHLYDDTATFYVTVDNIDQGVGVLEDFTIQMSGDQDDAPFMQSNTFFVSTVIYGGASERVTGVFTVDADWVALMIAAIDGGDNQELTVDVWLDDSNSVKESDEMNNIWSGALSTDAGDIIY
jgi:hypothetical protein